MERIGFKKIDLLYQLNNENIISDLLFFDTLYIDFTPNEIIKLLQRIDKVTSSNNCELFIEKLKHIYELVDSGLIILGYPTGINETSYPGKIPIPRETMDILGEVETRNLAYMKKLDAEITKENLDSILQLDRETGQYLCYLESYIYNYRFGYNCTPLLNNDNVLKNLNISSLGLSKKEMVTSVILNHLPVISTDVGISQLREFKNDQDARNKFLAIRNFMIELSKKPFSIHEMYEHIEYLLNEYEKQLRLHTKDINYTSWQNFLITTMEVVEDIANKKFSSAVKKIIGIENKEIELLKAEQNFAGREVAYIHKIKTELGAK